jgi:hypothetical protein
MPIYYGQSADGSDMKMFEGVYHNEVTGQWSNMPEMIFTKKERKEERVYWFVYDYLAKNHRSVMDEYELIIAKKSELSKLYRDYIINRIENKQN